MSLHGREGFTTSGVSDSVTIGIVIFFDNFSYWQPPQLSRTAPLFALWFPDALPKAIRQKRRNMSSNGNGVSSNPNAVERGEFGQVSLQEPSKDVAEIKKAAATASSGGILNHPGASRTLFIHLRSTAHTRCHVGFWPPVAHCAALPVLCYCLASIMMTVINKVRILSPLHRVSLSVLTAYAALLSP